MAPNHPPSSDKTIRKIDIAQVRVTILTTLFFLDVKRKIPCLLLLERAHAFSFVTVTN